jgi:hypothetical protein
MRATWSAAPREAAGVGSGGADVSGTVWWGIRAGKSLGFGDLVRWLPVYGGLRIGPGAAEQEGQHEQHGEGRELRPRAPAAESGPRGHPRASDLGGPGSGIPGLSLHHRSHDSSPLGSEGFLAQAPVMLGKATTPPSSTTSSRMRWWSVSMPTSSAVATPNSSVSGSMLRIRPAR